MNISTLNISKQFFGEVEGKAVDLYSLTNSIGMTVKVMTFGASVTSFTVPDAAPDTHPNVRHGSVNIVCGFDNLAGYFDETYLANSPYFGGTIGRYAARIKNGKIKVNGTEHQLACNAAENHIHGGSVGFDKRLWLAETIEQTHAVGVKMSLVSEDGDEGYPGEVTVSVTYLLTNDGELVIHYEANTTKDTPLSLTNHTYFNLTGFKESVHHHQLQLAGSSYLVADETCVPVGEVAQVEGTVWDYRQQKSINDVFAEQSMGFEHYYIYDKACGEPSKWDELSKVVTVTEPKSGRKLEVSTTEPGGLFYTGFYTSNELKRENGDQYGQFRGFCIETSRYPNGSNIEGSPASITKAGETYQSTTVYKVS